MYVCIICIYKSRDHDPRPWLATGRLRVGHSVSSGPLSRNRFGPKPPSPTRNPLSLVDTWYIIPHFPHFPSFVTPTLLLFALNKKPQTSSQPPPTFGSNKDLGQGLGQARITRTLHLPSPSSFVFGSFYTNRLVCNKCLVCLLEWYVYEIEKCLVSSFMYDF